MIQIFYLKVGLEYQAIDCHRGTGYFVDALYIPRYVVCLAGNISSRSHFPEPFKAGKQILWLIQLIPGITRGNHKPSSISSG